MAVMEMEPVLEYKLFREQLDWILMEHAEKIHGPNSDPHYVLQVQQTVIKILPVMLRISQKVIT